MDTTKAYLIYKLIHLFGVGHGFLSFGGMTMHAILGRNRMTGESQPSSVMV